MYRFIFLISVLVQVEIAEREQELIKGIELIRQKMVESTSKVAQRVIELNDELAELEVIFFILILIKNKLNYIFNYPAFLSSSSNGDFKVGENIDNGKRLHR